MGLIWYLAIHSTIFFQIIFETGKVCGLSKVGVVGWIDEISVVG